MKVVVTDTGPLLHLHQAGVIHQLAHFGQAQMTPTVWSELQRHRAESTARHAER